MAYNDVAVPFAFATEPNMFADFDIWKSLGWRSWVATGRVVDSKRSPGLGCCGGGTSSLEYAPDRGIDAVDAEFLQSCLQCGTCSAICPMINYMDHSPRALNAMLQAGRSDDVLRSRAIWVCTSCYACTVECPKQLPVTDTIYALRRASMRAELYPRRFPVPTLVSRFVDLVDRRGRSSEFWISLSLTLRTRPVLLLQHAPLALRLLRRGRMNMRHESVRERAQIRDMLAVLDASGGEPQ